MQWTTAVCSSISRRMLNAEFTTRTTFCLLIVVLMSVIGRCQETSPKDNSQLVMIRSNDTNTSETPDKIQITIIFRNDDRPISLLLLRNKNVETNVSVILGRNGRLRNHTVNLAQKCAFYTDLATDASVLMKAEINGDGTVSRSYSGLFQARGETYAIEPDLESARRRRRRRSGRGLRRILSRRQAADPSDLHVVQKLNTSVGNTGSPLAVPNGSNQPTLFERVDSSPGSGGGNTVLDPVPKTTNVISALAIIDFSIYQQMLSLSTESTDDAKEQDTIDRITQFYGHVFNAVDMRYRSINTSSMAYAVRFAGCYIAQDNDSAPFIEKNRVSIGSSSYVMAARALNDFSDWVNQNNPTVPLPPHNQASLYTLYPMTGSSGDRISGLAYYRALCSYWSVLICRHASPYAIAAVTAHELGHNLGAVHDGIDNACSASARNIMAASSAPLTDAVYKNAYKFSSCSVSEMASYVQTLPPNNCLTKPSDSSLTPESSTPLGAIYSPDEQCAIIYGKGSFYCGGLNEDKQICRTMSCFHPVWQYCVSTYEQRAFSGTQCGNKMRCYMGDCVPSDEAPELAPGVSADCLYGDSRVPFDDDFQCGDVSSQPWKCYQGAVANSCCRSCRNVMDESIAGCEYGDRFAGCADYQLINCNDPAIKQSCCRTCALLNSALVRNDRITSPTASTTRTTTPTTTSTTTTSTTTTSPTTTTTTSTTSTTQPTTKPTMSTATSCTNFYGSWCLSPSNFPPSYCYTQIRYLCCAFCARIRDDSRPGCEYGDRNTWCDASRCVNPSERESCCGSCSSVLSFKNTTSTSTTPTTTTASTTTTVTSRTTTPATTSTTATTTTSTTTAPTTTSRTTSTTAPTSTNATMAIGRTTRSAAAGAVCDDNKAFCATIDQPDCYLTDRQTTCCRTCRKYLTGPPGCEYGDKLPRICTTIRLSDCPSYKSECCQTCSGVTR